MDIIGGSVLIIGDLHFSDVFKGRHRDYLSNCFWALGKISAKVREMQPSAVVLLGDIVGWNETNVKNRQVFAALCKELKEWNSVCPVFSVCGNHDIKGYPDFLFLAELGMLKTSSSCGGYFDYYGYEGQDKPEVRFHMVDYKTEDKHLDLIEDGSSNIVLAHNNFTIDGITTWYAQHDGIELGMQQNFSGVDIVISGHIHNSSPEIVSATMAGGRECMLFYPGCPTRPIRIQDVYDSCWFVEVKYNPESKDTEINPHKFELPPVSEIFYDDDEFIEEKTEDELAEEVRKEALHDILEDLLQYRMGTGDPISQVMRIPNASDEAKAKAVEYLNYAFGADKM